MGAWVAFMVGGDSDMVDTTVGVLVTKNGVVTMGVGVRLTTVTFATGVGVTGLVAATLKARSFSESDNFPSHLYHLPSGNLSGVTRMFVENEQTSTI